jgi:putative two-component system response regulator
MGETLIAVIGPASYPRINACPTAGGIDPDPWSIPLDYSATASPEASILIVDDSPTQILLLREILLSAGYTRLYQTQDSRQAVALHRRHDVDLILLDLNMPYLSGFDVLERFNAQAGGGRKPIIIAVSGQTDQKTRERVLALGAKNFIAKPYRIERLLWQVRRELELYPA